MEAYLAAEAVQALRASAPAGSAAGRRVSPRTRASGFLVGRTRGGCFYVDRAVAAPPGFRPTDEALARMDDLLAGAVVGFYAAGPGRTAERAVLRPFACGKLYVEIRPGAEGSAVFLGFTVEYDGAFRLEPIDLRFEPEGEGG